MHNKDGPVEDVLESTTSQERSIPSRVSRVPSTGGGTVPRPNRGSVITGDFGRPLVPVLHLTLAVWTYSLLLVVALCPTVPSPVTTGRLVAPLNPRGGTLTCKEKKI